MRRSILLALLFALYTAPLAAAEPALERIYDAEPLQRELPGFPKPRPGDAGGAGSAGGSGGDGELTLTLGSGQGSGQGAGRGGQGAADTSGERGAHDAQGRGQGGGGDLRIKLEGSGDGRGQGSKLRGDGGGDSARRGAGEGQGSGQGGLKVELSGQGGVGGEGQGSQDGAAGGQGGLGNSEGELGAAGAGEHGAGSAAGASEAPAAPSAPEASPKAPHEPEPPKLTPQERPDPSALIFKIVGGALVAALIIGFIVWLARRVRERAAAPPQALAAPNTLLDELAARAGDAPPLTLAEQGRWAEAIHALLLEALRGVLAREAGLGQPSLTARAICARAALGEAARGALATLVQAAELCVFAGEQADQQLYLRCAAAADALRAELDRGGAR